MQVAVQRKAGHKMAVVKRNTKKAKPQPTNCGAEHTPHKTMLQQADELISGDRQQDYGDKLANFVQIAMGMQAVLARKLLPGVVITATDVGLLMLQVKIARLAHMPLHADSLLDVAGYAGCIEKLLSEADNFILVQNSPNNPEDLEVSALQSEFYTRSA